MKALVIYDATGKIWSIFYGEDQVPQGLLALFVDIPDGGQLERIDVTNPDDPGILQLNKPIMRYRPNKACFFNVKFFVLYYSILWYFL